MGKLRHCWCLAPLGLHSVIQPLIPSSPGSMYVSPLKQINLVIWGFLGMTWTYPMWMDKDLDRIRLDPWNNLRSALAWASLVAQMVKNLPAMQETKVWSLGQEDSPGKGNGNPFQYSNIILPGEFHGQRSQADYSPWGCKESDMTELLTLSLSSLQSWPWQWQSQDFPGWVQTGPDESWTPHPENGLDVMVSLLLE